MGSAVTFPVESFIFLGVILAVLSRGDIRKIEGFQGSVSVFGDDLIIPAADREAVVEALEALSFKVNTAKSFSTGNFRESCGVDSFAGVTVTPVYLGHLDCDTIERVVGMTATANHFYQRWLLNVASVLRRTVCKRYTLADVHPLSMSFGFQTRVPPLNSPRVRWNEQLQRSEVKVATVKTRQTITKPTDDTGLLQFFTEEPSPHEKWEAGYGRVTATKIRSSWVEVEPLYKRWLDH